MDRFLWFWDGLWSTTCFCSESETLPQSSEESFINSWSVIRELGVLLANLDFFGFSRSGDLKFSTIMLDLRLIDSILIYGDEPRPSMLFLCLLAAKFGITTAGSSSSFIGLESCLCTSSRRCALINFLLFTFGLLRQDYGSFLPAGASYSRTFLSWKLSFCSASYVCSLTRLRFSLLSWPEFGIFLAFYSNESLKSLLNEEDSIPLLDSGTLFSLNFVISGYVNQKLSFDTIFFAGGCLYVNAPSALVDLFCELWLSLVEMATLWLLKCSICRPSRGETFCFWYLSGAPNMK